MARIGTDKYHRSQPPPMNAAVPLNQLVDEIVEANELFTDVAMGEGAAPLLVLMGMLLIVFAAGVFGLLTLGAVVDVVTPE